mmetsp:Transcript_6504/g.13329  ORF Transcript_6504/g.13329 Transcript_6504/m.13329 type:complete len:202 (-) Transcript_6504:269-874(-)
MCTSIRYVARRAAPSLPAHATAAHDPVNARKVLLVIAATAPWVAALWAALRLRKVSGVQRSRTGHFRLLGPRTAMRTTILASKRPFHLPVARTCLLPRGCHLGVWPTLLCRHQGLPLPPCPLAPCSSTLMVTIMQATQPDWRLAARATSNLWHQTVRAAGIRPQARLAQFLQMAMCSQKVRVAGRLSRTVEEDLWSSAPFA